MPHLNENVKEVLKWMLYLFVGIMPFIGIIIFLTAMPFPNIIPLVITLIIPVTCLILLFIWAFKNNNHIRQTFSKAILYWYLIIAIIIGSLQIISYFTGSTPG